MIRVFTKPFAVLPIALGAMGMFTFGTGLGTSSPATTAAVVSSAPTFKTADAAVATVPATTHGSGEEATTTIKAENCSAFGVVSGGVTFWGGCPSLSCAQFEDINTDCQSEDGIIPGTRVCKCGEDFTALCIAVVFVDEDDPNEILDWGCAKKNCQGSCTEAMPPGSGTFFLCDC